MKKMKSIANQTSFVLTVVCLFIFISLNLFNPTTDHDLILYLMVLAVATFVIGVAGLPFERKSDKKQVVKSVFSLIASLLLTIVLGILWVFPVLFPFGIPPL